MITARSNIIEAVIKIFFFDFVMEFKYTAFKKQFKLKALISIYGKIHFRPSVFFANKFY